MKDSGRGEWIVTAVEVGRTRVRARVDPDAGRIVAEGLEDDT